MTTVCADSDASRAGLRLNSDVPVSQSLSRVAAGAGRASPSPNTRTHCTVGRPGRLMTGRPVLGPATRAAGGTWPATDGQWCYPSRLTQAIMGPASCAPRGKRRGMAAWTGRCAEASSTWPLPDRCLPICTRGLCRAALAAGRASGPRAPTLFPHVRHWVCGQGRAR